jgi:heme-degrading monooxygenase HmoA
MLALLFEVTPTADGYQKYLDIAAALRPALDQQEGFLFIERYRSLSRPGTILSHSLWRDEASLAAWRTLEVHHRAQVAGRNSVFVDYRIRIAAVICARTAESGDWQTSRLSSYRDPGAQAPRYVVITTSTQASSGAGTESFESLSRPGQFLSLKEEGALSVAKAQLDSVTISVRICEVERDYGMFDRREAPQYYPPVVR